MREEIAALPTVLVSYARQNIAFKLSSHLHSLFVIQDLQQTQTAAAATRSNDA